MLEKHQYRNEEELHDLTVQKNSRIIQCWVCIISLKASSVTVTGHGGVSGLCIEDLEVRNQEF